MTAIPRPQPVGVFPFPQSHLLAPPGNEALRAAAVNGDESAAAAILPASAAAIAGSSPLDRHNAFVLSPSAAGLAAIEAAGDASFIALARAAAFAHGLIDDLPDPGPLDGRAVPGIRARDRIAQRARVEQRAQLVDLARLRGRDRGDDRSALRPDLDQSLAGEPLQGLPQRRRAHRESPREVGHRRGEFGGPLRLAGPGRTACRNTMRSAYSVASRCTLAIPSTTEGSAVSSK